jgi:hypothetical protein
MDQRVPCQDHEFANTEQSHRRLKAASFLAYGDPLEMALACTALGFSALTAAVLQVFVKHRETPIVKANNQTLSYILLTSLTCCFLCSLLFIGRPNKATCMLQETMFGVVCTVAVSSALAKPSLWFWPSQSLPREKGEMVAGVMDTKLHRPHLHSDPTESLWNLAGNLSPLYRHRCTL